MSWLLVVLSGCLPGGSEREDGLQAIARWEDRLRGGETLHGLVDELPADRRERVMAKIRPLLGEVRHILLSPDGALNLVPFEALVDEQGRPTSPDEPAPLVVTPDQARHVTPSLQPAAAALRALPLR